MARTSVRELMTPNPITVSPHETVDRAVDLMSRYHIRRLPVVRDGKLVGIITDRDVRRLSARPSLKLPPADQEDAYRQLPVEEAMTLTVITLQEYQSVGDAIRSILKNKIGGLPVLDREGTLAGILSEQDILKHCLELLEREAD
ncbi:MAG TPA: CBS domain-containing protein [Nitrospiria bacterium]